MAYPPPVQAGEQEEDDLGVSAERLVGGRSSRMARTPRPAKPTARQSSITARTRSVITFAAVAAPFRTARKYPLLGMR